MTIRQNIGTRTEPKGKQGQRHIEGGAIMREVHIIASPFKTGSSSVGKALLELGVGTTEMPYNGKVLRAWRSEIKRLNALADKASDFAWFQSKRGARVLDTLAGLVETVAPFDVFHDAPMGHAHIHPFVRKIMAPKARFIWVNREAGDWLESVRNWQVTHPQTYPKYTLWETEPEKRAQRFILRRQSQYRDFCRLRLAVPSDCIELDWADLASFEALAEFYGVPVPDGTFPKENVSR